MKTQSILSTFTCIFVLSCAEKQVDLGAGYKYVKLDGVNAAIADRDSHMVVDPNVKRYRVIGSYVVGERVNADIRNCLRTSATSSSICETGNC